MKTFAVLVLFFVIVPSLSVAGPNRMPNGNMESAVAGYPFLATGWDPYFRYRRVVDPANSWSGSAYIILSQGATPTNFAGAKKRVFLNQLLARPVRVHARVKGFNIANQSADLFGASLYVSVALRDGQIVRSRHTAKTKNIGTFDWREIGVNTASLGITTPISHIDVFPILGRVPGTAWFDDVFVEEFPADRGRPAVTIMFDDGYKNVRTIAEPIMSYHGFRGTLAPFVAAVRGTEALYMRLTDLRYLLGRRWTVVSHGMNHLSLPRLPAAAMEDELYDSAVYFRNNGIPVWHFIYPFGDYNGQTWGFAQWYYLSARGVERGDNPYGLLPFDIKIQECHYNTTSSEVSNWLSQAKARNRWLILLFHNVKPASSSADLYTVSTSLFRQIVSQVRSSGLRVLTYDEGFAEYSFDPVR